MRWCIAFILLVGCESKPAAPKPAPAPAVRDVPPAPAVQRTKPRGDAWAPTRVPTNGMWRKAEVGKTAEAWDAAAEASQEDLDACTEDCVEAAYEVVLARKNAMRAAAVDPPPGDEPAPVPPRVQAVVDALDAFVAIADPEDPDVVGAKFLAANALYRYRQPDAIARLEAQLRDHPDDETAEYAANTLLDLLLRSGRLDELHQWVARLLADDAFLVDRDALRETLEHLRTTMN